MCAPSCEELGIGLSAVGSDRALSGTGALRGSAKSRVQICLTGTGQWPELPGSARRRARQSQGASTCSGGSRLVAVVFSVTQDLAAEKTISDLPAALRQATYRKAKALMVSWPTHGRSTFLGRGAMPVHSRSWVSRRGPSSSWCGHAS